MPQGLYVINQREITITRSVVRDVVKGLIKDLVFPSDTVLVFDEMQGAVKLVKGSFEPCGNRVATDYNNYVFVEFQETYMESGYNRDTITKDRHLHLFRDHDIGMYAIPKYATMKIEMQLRFRSRDHTALTAFRNGLKASNTERSLMFKHDIFYDYNIDDRILYLATLAHTMKEKQFGTGEELKTYLARHFKEGVTVRTNIGGSHKQPICQECQRDITGVSNDSMPYNVVEVEEGIYETIIPYTVHYRQPVAVEVKIPLFIHNQFVGKDVIKLVEPLDKNVSDDKSGWTPIDYFQMNKGDTLRYRRGDGGTRLLPFDDWYPARPFQGTHTLCIAPIVVETSDAKKVANLNDLPDELLSKDIKDYLVDNYERDTDEVKRSLVHIEVFETYGDERSLDFTMDEDLNIRTLADLDPRFRVHLRISIFDDWSLLSNYEMNKLLANPEVCYKLALLLDSEVKYLEVGNGNITTKRDHLVNRNGVITRQSMRDWLVSLPTVNQAFKRAPGGFMRTTLMGGLSLRSK